MDKPLFKLVVLKEATEFLASLPDKVREKILSNAMRKEWFNNKKL